jgi:hypothetical protein
MLGLSSGHMNGTGITLFSLFVVAALALLAAVLANIKGTSVRIISRERKPG